MIGGAPAGVSVSRVFEPVSMLDSSMKEATPVGKVFWKHMSTVLGKKEESGGSAGGRKGKAVAYEFPDDKIKIPKNITPKNLHKFTLYDVLGLGKYAGSVDENAIKKAYHKAVLLYHPDKKQDKTADGQEDRTVFLKIQEAQATLSNEQKRRAYDSQLPFDDSAPSVVDIEKAIEAGENAFYDLYEPVFRRNARFAERKPVPEIGDINTPIDQVYKFYDYWINFDSWRDFTGQDAEYRPDEASSREEKRYMMKENEKKAKKFKKMEIARITKMTMTAMEKDPRVVADKKRVADIKDAAKNAKEMEQKKKEDELQAAREWALKQDEEAAELCKLNKVEKEKLKKKASAARNAFKKLLRAIAEQAAGAPTSGVGEFGAVSIEDVELLCVTCSLEEVSALNNALGGDAAVKDPSLLQSQGVEFVVSRALEIREEQDKYEQMERKAKEDAKKDAERRSKMSSPKGKKGSKDDLSSAERVWSREELSVLSKACSKYPAGTGQRWQAITNHMNDLLKPLDPYEIEDCMKAAHNVQKAVIKFGGVAKIGAVETISTTSSEAWTTEQQQALENVTLT